MNNPVACYRVDGSDQIGLGHVYRCLALAQMIDDQFIIRFYVREIPPALGERIETTFGYELITVHSEEEFLTELKQYHSKVVVVLDGYDFDGSYQGAVKKAGAKVVSVDDIHEVHFASDGVINHAPSILPDEYSTESYTKLYLGPAYALLREEYLRLTTACEPCKQLETAFVSMGGSDPDNITKNVIQVLAEQKSVTKANVVTGAGYDRPEEIAKIEMNEKLTIEHHHDIGDEKMIALMRRADFAIVPSSTILYEVMAARLPAITGFYVENQTKIYEGFKATGAVLGVGLLSKESISKGISALTVRKARQIQAKQQEVIDGKSPKRIRRIFNQLIT